VVNRIVFGNKGIDQERVMCVVCQLTAGVAAFQHWLRTVGRCVTLGFKRNQRSARTKSA